MLLMNDVSRRSSSISPVIKRFVAMPSSMTTKRRPRRKIRRPNLNKKPITDLNEVSLGFDFSKGDEAHWKFKIKQLREFTKTLQQQIQKADELKKLQETMIEEGVSEDDNGSEIEKDAGLIFEGLSGAGTVGDTKQIPVKSPSLSGLIMTASKELDNILPSAVVCRINDDNLIVKALADKRHRDWNAIVDALYRSEKRLKGLSTGEIKQTLFHDVSGLSFESIKQVEEMLTESLGDGITSSASFYGFLFSQLSLLKPGTSAYNTAVINKMRQLLEVYDSNESENKFQMDNKIMHSCLKFAMKLKSFKDMEFFLTKFKNTYGIQPDRKNYNTILQFYLICDQSQQVWDAFGAMKFLSLEHRPDTRTYNTMLRLCNREKNYAKAIDLYNEMTDLKVAPDIQTFAYLAKTLAACSADSIVSEGKAESLRLMGWKYIHEIEKHWKLDQEALDDSTAHYVFSSMMALAAYDGDVGFTRALYYKYTTFKFKKNLAMAQVWNKGSLTYKTIWRQSLNPEMFNYLLMSYSRYSTTKLPLLAGYDAGAKLRRNIIFSVDYMGRYDKDQGINVNIPMLPVQELTNERQILLESRALWHFNLEFGGDQNLRASPIEQTREKLESFVQECNSYDEFKFKTLHEVATMKDSLVNHRVLNSIALVSYLTIPLRLGDYTEFLLRLKEFTYHQHELEEILSKLYSSVKVIEPEFTKKSYSDNQKQIATQKVELDNASRFISSMKHKIVSSNAIYELIMKAATKFGNVELATTTWNQRGKFRKTDAFRSLEESEQKEKDRIFAQLIVSFFVSQKMLTDAFSIILASKRYIKWTYSMVKPLHKELQRIEDFHTCERLLSVVNEKTKIQKLQDDIRELSL
ncbi:Ccm1p Ecym_1424 [Eremothecium cymbalariae DBVPG|uniref:Mitochondrial 15S rRNA processing factor CCM1 n=1 Tax=Eremothecium cymbalariae (strain CBS 270.75 / DBVPG 7215 / KCTC 17166 / NRRL Y-17582) TaxID=931890 RepID=G8JM81_ERECY|nr:hypothetical protein Ecym_1424 [Eremothecium cymbalariae DBVPG\